MLWRLSHKKTYSNSHYIEIKNVYLKRRNTHKHRVGISFGELRIWSLTISSGYRLPCWSEQDDGYLKLFKSHWNASNSETLRASGQIFGRNARIKMSLKLLWEQIHAGISWKFTDGVMCGAHFHVLVSCLRFRSLSLRDRSFTSIIAYWPAVACLMNGLQTVVNIIIFRQKLQYC